MTFGSLLSVGSLRTKFLLSLALITALLTTAVLLTVRQRVQVRVREDITDSLRTSVVTFQRLQQQRESMLGRSAALLATLPPLKAVMTSQDRATIQDASKTFWELAGSQIFVLADRSGSIVAMHSDTAAFTVAAAQDALTADLKRKAFGGWWYGGGHLFQVFLQPISVGPLDNEQPIGLVAVGYEIDPALANDVGRVASAGVGFAFERNLVISNVSPAQTSALTAHIAELRPDSGTPFELLLDRERFLVTTVRLSPPDAPSVTLTVLKSFDAATRFLESLNGWIVGIGLAAVLAGSLLVYVVSTTFTRPLGQLVSGVRALERGDYDYPLEARGRDEISTLTTAFKDMRQQLQSTQRQLLDAEQLATIGRMANSISHDLRHPLTAILAYAEFLADRDLTEEQRKDFGQEIRIGVNRMTDEIDSLLGFSRQQQPIRQQHGGFGDVIEHAIKTVRALPEHETLAITFTSGRELEGQFDPGKLERVMLNLLFNAAESVPPGDGRIDIRCAAVEGGVEIQVEDNGSGIPPEIQGSLFQPFVTFGKEKGIGLGLTVVHTIMQQHGGHVRVLRTGPSGTLFSLFFPAAVAGQEYAGSSG